MSGIKVRPSVKGNFQIAPNVNGLIQSYYSRSVSIEVKKLFK